MKMLLEAVDPRRTHTPKGDPTPAIMRWRLAVLSEEFEHAHYPYTALGYAEEFCCLAAALYGRGGMGGADNTDVILRCAYYGHAQLTPEQVEQAYAKDGDAFTLAAVCNTGLVRRWDTGPLFRSSRMLEPRRFQHEDGIWGSNDSLRLLYNRRYKELFGAYPTTEEDTPPSSPEVEALARVEAGLTELVNALGHRLRIESQKIWWTLALIVLVLIVLWLKLF